MIRTLALAAVAAAVLAAPASAQSIRISTVGKSPEQVKAEVHKAARTLCARASWNASFPAEETAACVKTTVRYTYAQAGKAAQTRVAER
jgi:hypothetical protein